MGETFSNLLMVASFPNRVDAPARSTHATSASGVGSDLGEDKHDGYAVCEIMDEQFVRQSPGLMAHRRCGEEAGAVKP